MVKVEIVGFREKGFEVLARGEITEEKLREFGLTVCPDEVCRISDILWDCMLPEAKAAFLLKFGCKANG